MLEDIVDNLFGIFDKYSIKEFKDSDSDIDISWDVSRGCINIRNISISIMDDILDDLRKVFPVIEKRLGIKLIRSVSNGLDDRLLYDIEISYSVGYIKTFESYSLGYEEISFRDYQILLRSDSDWMNNQLKTNYNVMEIEFIKKYIPNIEVSGIGLYSSNLYNDNLHIIKIPDDWYLLALGITAMSVFSYYKCDQLDGLKNCIVDVYKNI